MTKALQKRIELANRYINFAKKNDVWGRGFFGSSMESVFEYSKPITVSSTGRMVRVRYQDVFPVGGKIRKYSESFNTEDPYQVSELRYEITHYIIKAIQRGAADEGISLPKTLTGKK